MKFAKLFALASLLLVPAFAQAKTTIDITPSLPAGRYDHPIYVKLTASDPLAQIWYTCKRNGTPSDLIKYEEPILLSKSCALVYFGYITTQLESKIKRSDYTIFYSDNVKLETKDDILSLRNTGDQTVDVGGWGVIAGTGSTNIPAGTTITPGGTYTIGAVTPASYELTSPEGYIKSAIAIEVRKAQKIAAKQPTKPVKPSTETRQDPVPVVTNTGTTNTGMILSENIVPPTTAPDTPTAIEKPKPAETSTLKASASENSNTNQTVAIIVITLLVASGIGFQFVRK